MAAANNLVVRISAVDATSAAIDAVAKRLAGITAPATKVTKSLARLSDASGVTKLTKAVAHLGGTAVRAGDHLVGALAPLGALTAALSVGGFAKMTSDWARMSQALSFDAARIGSGVSQLHALEGSARLSGSSAEAAASGIRNLQDVMTDTVGGRNMEALTYFRQLGVAFDDGRGHALRATAVLPKLADAIAKIKDPSLQARVATQFFGGAAESLLPWLRRGSEGMAEYAEMARHYGVQTEESAASAGIFRLAQTRLALAFEGLGNSISEKVSPPLAELMTWMSELVARNRGLISDKFGYWAKQLADWIKSIDWEKTTKYFSDLFDRFERWTDAMSKFTVPSWMKKMFGLGGDPANVPLGDPKQVTPLGTGGEQPAKPDASGVIQPKQSSVLDWLDGVLGRKKPSPQGDPATGQRMMSYFEGQGWAHGQAAGIVANLERESAFDPSRPGDNGQAYGIAQWHADRQKKFAEWSGHDIRGSTLDEQMRFVQWELTHSEKAAGDLLKTAPNASTAAYVVNSRYERPADIPGENTIRGQGAERWAGRLDAKVADETPADHSTWVDKLDDGPFKRMLQGGTSAAPAAPATSSGQAPAGKVDVHVRLSGLPQGAAATTTASGDTNSSVAIHRAMP